MFKQGISKLGIDTVPGNIGAIPHFALTLRDRWARWRGVSVNRSVFASSLLLMGLAVVCKLFAAGREIVTAYFYGTGSAVDSFVVALMLPSFAISIIASAAGTTAIPMLTRTRQEHGHAAAENFLREFTSWCLLLLVGAAFLIAATSPWLVSLVGSGFDSAKQNATYHLLLLLIPAILFHGLASLWGAVLQSHEEFAATGLVPILTPFVAIVTMMWCGDRWGIQALAIGILVGSAAEAATLAYILTRKGFRLTPLIRSPSSEMRQAARQFAPLVAAAVLMGSTTLVDNAMAAQLGSGSVATLSYGHKIVALAVAIPAMSLAQAVFPCFSRLAAVQDWQQIRHTLSTYRKLILLGTIPLACLLVILARPITALALQRGAFDQSCTQDVAWVQAMYAIQIPFFTLGLLYARLASSLHLNHLLTISTLISILLNVLLNLLLMRSMGVAGIALSTSLVYAASCVFMLVSIHSLWKQQCNRLVY